MRARLGFIPIGIVTALAFISVGGSALATPSGPLSEVGHARAATRTAAEFYAPRALGMECGMYLDGVHCQSMRTRHNFAQVAEMRPNGTVTVCSTHRLNPNTCDLGNAGEHTPTLSRGKRITVGPFRCQILRTGVECTVISTGKGFLMSRKKVVSVGGASFRPAPLHLGNFLSPDRKVWCGLGEARAFCGAGLSGLHETFPLSLAQLERGGKVTICFITERKEPPAGHAPEGCLQNWDEKAPILRYGQETELEGIRCRSATDGITCTEVAGAGTGRGFRVSSSEAVQVG